MSEPKTNIYTINPQIKEDRCFAKRLVARTTSKHIHAQFISCCSSPASSLQSSLKIKPATHAYATASHIFQRSRWLSKMLSRSPSKNRYPLPLPVCVPVAAKPWPSSCKVATCGTPAGLRLGSSWMATCFADCLQQARNFKARKNGDQRLSTPYASGRPWMLGYESAAFASLGCWMAQLLACCRSSSLVLFD